MKLYRICNEITMSSSNPQRCSVKIFTTLAGNGLTELFRIAFNDGHSSIRTQTLSDSSRVEHLLPSIIISNEIWLYFNDSDELSNYLSTYGTSLSRSQKSAKESQICV